MSRTERFYRLVVRSFPRAWRDRHGDDLVATLLEQSKHGSRTGAIGDIADVVRSGWTHRAHSFGLRRSLGFVGLAALTAVVGYLTLSAGTGSSAGSIATLWVIYLGVALSPGVNFALIAQTATTRSRRDAMYVAAGVTTATTVWMIASLAGLIALAERAGTLFQVVRIGAGIYLIWLGVQKFRRRSHAAQSTAAAARPESRSRSFAAGFVTNMGNPKAILFFGSLFATALPSDASTTLRLVAAFVILASSIAIHAGLASVLSLASVRSGYDRARRWIDPAFGAVFVLFGARLVRSEA